MDTTDMKKPGVLVVGPNVWGKGQMLDQALKNASRPKAYIAWAVPFPLKEINVSELGDVMWPRSREDRPPFRIVEKGLRKKEKERGHGKARGKAD